MGDHARTHAVSAIAGLLISCSVTLSQWECELSTGRRLPETACAAHRIFSLTANRARCAIRMSPRDLRPKALILLPPTTRKNSPHKPYPSTNSKLLCVAAIRLTFWKLLEPDTN